MPYYVLLLEPRGLLRPRQNTAPRTANLEADTLNCGPGTSANTNLHIFSSIIAAIMARMKGVGRGTKEEEE